MKPYETPTPKEIFLTILGKNPLYSDWADSVALAESIAASEMERWKASQPWLKHLDMPIEEFFNRFKISTRAIGALDGLHSYSHGAWIQLPKINTLRDLVVLSDSQLLKAKNFGRKSLKEVKAALAELGLGLGMNLGDHP